MALTVAQQRVLDLTRDELLLNSLSDAEVAGLLEKLFTKARDGGRFTDEEQHYVRAITERFNWLAALAVTNGYGGDEPALFTNRGTGINTGWITYWAKERNIDITVAAEQAIYAVEQHVNYMHKTIAEMRAIVNTPRYEVAHGEPSIFGGGIGAPGTDWMLWYSKMKETSIINAYEAGRKIIANLLSELPRTLPVGGREPEVWVEPSKELEAAGISHRALSLEWVVYAKYTRKLDWYEAHHDGLTLLRGRT